MGDTVHGPDNPEDPDKNSCAMVEEFGDDLDDDVDDDDVGNSDDGGPDDKLCHGRLKTLSRELGRPLETLTTSYTNDPFFADTPKRRAWAEWFLSLWQRLEPLRHRQREINERFLSDLDPILGRYSNIINRCNSVLSSVLERYRAEAGPFIERYRSEAREIADEINAAIDAIIEDMTDEAPDPETYEWPEPAEGDEVPDPLFDSRRDYVAQIDRYKRHHGKPTSRKECTKEIKPRKPYQRKPKTGLMGSTE